jgi:predicted N-acetyltransferase YhbS
VAASPPDVHILPELAGDAVAIASITREAFRTHPHSRHTEELIIAALREAGALSVSLVAEVSGRAVGHIAYSPVSVSDRSPRWYGLGPVAVVPRAQRVGIGSALVLQSLSVLRDLGAEGCVVLGEPGFYARFGFANRQTLSLAGVPPRYFLALSLSGRFPVGEVAYHAAFTAGSR